MQTEVLCVGMAVVDVFAKGLRRFPETGGTQFIDGVSIQPGGDALNQAIVLSALGHKTGLMSMVGADEQGGFLRSVCARKRIETRGIAVDARYPTSTSIVLTAPDGERSFISQRSGSADNFALEHVDLRLIQDGVRAVSIGSLCCSRAFDEEALLQVLLRSRAVGATTFADMVPNVREADLSEYTDAFAALDYLMPSLDEAVLFTGETEPERAAAALLKLGVGHVILKLGARGALYMDATRKRTIPIIPGRVVDTTGAGDNFVAGFVSACLRGYPIDQALRFAAATASVSIETLGANKGVTDVRQILERMEG